MGPSGPPAWVWGLKTLGVAGLGFLRTPSDFLWFSYATLYHTQKNTGSAEYTVLSGYLYELVCLA